MTAQTPNHVKKLDPKDRVIADALRGLTGKEWALIQRIHVSGQDPADFLRTRSVEENLTWKTIEPMFELLGAVLDAEPEKGGA